jgi:hypothetical protein
VDGDHRHGGTTGLLSFYGDGGAAGIGGNGAYKT